MRLRRILNAVFPRLPERATVDLQEWRNIPSGIVKTLEDKSGHRWALMHDDDFEHIFSRSPSLQMKRVSETVGAEPE